MSPNTTNKNSRKKKLEDAVSARVAVLDKERTPDNIMPLHAIEHQAVRQVFKTDPESGTLPLSKIQPDPEQVRKVKTTGEDFDGLVASIREHGVIQPITVRWIAEDKFFQIITGERRYLAAKRAKLQLIPVVIRDVDDTKKAVQQLVENIQREDLNPIEEAKAFERYLVATKSTQQQLAKAIGKSKNYVSSSLSLLEKLSRDEQSYLAEVPPAELPRKSLILEAVRTDDSELRMKILRGEYNREQAREAVKHGKPRGVVGKKTKFIREYAHMPKTGATIRLISDKRMTEDTIEEALKEGLREHRKHRR